MKKQTAMRKVRLGPVKLEFSPPVFLISAGVILFMVLLAIIFSAGLEEIVGNLQTTISLNAGWFYILVVNGLLLFALYLLLGRYGRIRLGGPEAEPEFSRFAWLAMLFSTGMGIRLVFWSVAEPITHYSSPPYGEPGSPAAGQTHLRPHRPHHRHHRRGGDAVRRGDESGLWRGADPGRRRPAL